METSGNRQVKKRGKTGGTRVLACLLVGFCLVISNNAFCQVSLNDLTADQNPLNCNGGTTTITATVVSGTGPYEFFLDGASQGTNTTYTNVGAGNHSVRVVDASDGTTDTKSITITQPSAISFSVTGSYACTEGSGTFDVAVSGGTPNYTVSVSGGPTTPPNQSGAGPNFTFSNLNGGTYTITVTDANNCPVPTKQHTISVDASAPTSPLPDDVETDYLTFTTGNQTNVTVSTPGPFNYSIPGGNNNTGILDFYNYTNANYSFDIVCTGTPSATDIIRILESQDGISFPTTLATLTGAVSGTVAPDLIDLNVNPMSNRLVVIRIEVEITTPGLVYDISNFLIRADQRVNTGSYTTSAPLFSDDVSGLVAPPTSTDDEVHWICSAAGSEELTFTRNWSATDRCGRKSASIPQNIRVGTPPTFGPLPASVTYDFCHNSGVPIVPPTVSDNCTVPANLVLEWRVFDSDENPVSEWISYSTVTTYDFSPAPEGQEFLIGWRVTDEAGFTTEIGAGVTTQRIIFKPVITLSLIVPSSYQDVCEGNAATFNIHAVGGGTGGYQITAITPAPATALPLNFSATDATFSYDAANPIAAGSSIVVTYQDVDYGTPTVVGGCSSPTGTVTFQSGVDGYTIHQKIPTGTITRDP